MTATTAAQSSGVAQDARTERLLRAPVASTLLRLAAPNLGEAAARVAFISLDAVFVGWLGTGSLAAVALVFPIFLTMQTVSAGGFGAGVASAIARSLGAGRAEEASAIGGFALMLSALVGLAFGIAMLIFGPDIYAAMGARGQVLEQALAYSGVVLGGAVLIWLMNISANVVRGTGNMLVPASAIVIGEVAHVVISPVLILGLGPAPELGVLGAAIGVLAAYATGAVVVLGYLLSGRSIITLSWKNLKPSRQGRAEMLGVGAFGALNVLQFQFLIIVLSAFAGAYGAATVAGFGAALRLELLQIPIIFAFGSAIVTMTATNAGAGSTDRVRRIAFCGGAISFLIGGAFAIVAIVVPDRWMAMFSTDGEVIAQGTRYLEIIGPTLPVTGLAVGLFYACVGVGRIAMPFAIGVVRLAVVAGGGAIVVLLLREPAPILYVLVAASAVAYGLAILWNAWWVLRA